MDLQLTGKVALVTGGSRGIGRAVSETLAGEGCLVAIVGRDADAAESAARAISAATGSQAIPVSADTGDDASVSAMAERVAAALGPVGILVNCAAEPAGQGRTIPVEEVGLHELMRHMNVKVMGYLRTAQAVIPGMRRAGWGRIICISGMGARRSGDTVGSIRNVSVVAMVKNLADALAGTGITATVVHPGITRTEKVAAMIARRAAEQAQTEAEVEARMAANLLMEQLPTPQDIANVVAFLASPRSRAINGDVIAAAGGMRGTIHY